jgi:cytoskeletal protein CcmA (bactofilin family)
MFKRFFPFLRGNVAPVEASQDPADGTTTELPIKTLVGAQSVIEGTVSDPLGVKVDGTVKGSVKVDGDGLLIVSKGAVIDGSVLAKRAVIAGSVKGQVLVSQLRVLSSARIEGNLRYATIAAEDGAQIRGLLSDEKVGEADSLEKVQKLATRDAAPRVRLQQVS